ncbi:MAG: hypothetical protein Q8916_09460 [Bacteroidota bacterium]|nr:hypothetical protein [Bacteroidota bacterium]MDP4230615.1 hypothetical protein [Bacteroidota bacterium]MDP4235485.1 hypothetical protein [Bacteroidota bacterium]
MKLQDIRDIVRIIERYDSGTAPVVAWPDPSREGQLSAKFHLLMIRDTVRSDSEAAKRIYGERFSPTKYKSLKSSYLSTTINRIGTLSIAQSGLSEYAKAIYKAHKYLFFISFLLSSGSRSGGIGLAMRLLKLADKYEFHTIAIALLNELRKDAMQSGKASEYRKYLRLYESRIRLLANESQITALEESITLHFSKSLFVPEKLKAEVRTAVRQAKKLLPNGDTYFARISYYRLLYISYQVEGEIAKSAAACDEAIQYMLSKPHMSPPSRFAEFALYKLENYILLRDYENGKMAAAYCEKHINKGMNIWFSYKEYEFLLLMQTTKFIEADAIYQEVRTHERFSSLPIHLQERWQIFGLHIQYVMRSNSARTSDTEAAPFRKSYLMRNKEFKGRLLDFPTYRRDKRGFNVAILTLNILVALEDNMLDLLLQQEEALSSYRFKYLNEKHCKQSFILFKLIRLVTKNEFDLAKIGRKAKLIEKSLDMNKLGAGEIFECIQILPPGWVWTRIKTILANRK